MNYHLKLYEEIIDLGQKYSGHISQEIDEALMKMSETLEALLTVEAFQKIGRIVEMEKERTNER